MELFSRETAPPDQPFSRLMHQLEHFRDVPPDGDEIIGLLSGSAHKAFGQHPALRNVVQTFATNREDEKPAVTYNILRTVVQTECLKELGRLPDNEQDWDEYFAVLEKSNDVDDDRFANFATSLFTTKVHTNLWSRYGMAEVLMQLYAEDRFSEGITWLDDGCAYALGPHALALKDSSEDFALEPVTVLDPDSRQKDPLMSAKLRRLMRLPSVLGRGVAMDIFDPYHPDNEQAAIGSLRPEAEINNPAFMRTFTSLLDARPRNIATAVVDLSSRQETEKFIERNPNLKFNFVSLITMRSQLSTYEDAAMQSLLQDIETPDAIEYTADFAFQRARGGALHFYKDWHSNDFPYRGYVYDRANPHLGNQEIMRAETSRCKNIILMGGKLALRNTELQLPDVVNDYLATQP